MRSPVSVQSISDLNRQELRSLVGARNQVSVSTANVSMAFCLKNFSLNRIVCNVSQAAYLMSLIRNNSMCLCCENQSHFIIVANVSEV